MGLKKFLENMGKEPQRPDIPDDVTRDMALKGLRRQRRVQLEEEEKKKLKKQIADFNKRRTSRELFGFKSPPKDSQILMKGKVKRTVSFTDGSLIGKEKKSMLGKSGFFK